MGDEFQHPLFDPFPRYDLVVCSADAIITNHLLFQVLFTENLLVSRESCSSAIEVSFITALCVICRLVNLFLEVCLPLCTARMISVTERDIRSVCS